MIKQEWKTIEKPGWFGEDRDKRMAEYDNKFGAENWRIRHQLGPYALNFQQAVHIYELCYELDYLHPDRRFLWKDLVTRAQDVWTERLSDIESGTDYSIQKAPAAHYEDIAIRRILHKQGLSFQGKDHVRIRADSDDLVGKALSSIHIPFIYPQYIEPPTNDEITWYNRHKGSLEHFWHANKILQVRETPLDNPPIPMGTWPFLGRNPFI
jgi:hypothetical protein